LITTGIRTPFNGCLNRILFKKALDVMVVIDDVILKIQDYQRAAKENNFKTVKR